MVHPSIVLLFIGVLFFSSTFLCCVEPASEVLLVLVLSAVIQCSRVISKLLLDKLVSCQDEGLEVQLAEIRYGPLGAVLLNGSD